MDAIGTKRFDSEKAGDREVQRTMLELLNQLDGFSSADDIKVIAATNRIDILDPALLRYVEKILLLNCRKNQTFFWQVWAVRQKDRVPSPYRGGEG